MTFMTMASFTGASCGRRGRSGGSLQCRKTLWAVQTTGLPPNISLRSNRHAHTQTLQHSLTATANGADVIPNNCTRASYLHGNCLTRLPDSSLCGAKC